ncbi:MAG: hypothetical protein NVS3B3_18630 [Aquirhabdus sp.]
MNSLLGYAAVFTIALLFGMLIGKQQTDNQVIRECAVLGTTKTMDGGTIKCEIVKEPT